MELRITGTPDECDQAADVLRTAFEVREVSRFYSNRGETTLGRVFVQVALKPPVVRADAARLDRKEVER
ncbi:MAG: hypothetical protein HOQ21_10050 [Dermatophilaceae bacterium]|nr:hypothetical protein [Dermatophilaceae bacterium]